MFWKKRQGGILLTQSHFSADKSPNSSSNLATFFRLKSRKFSSIRYALLALLIIISTWLYSISETFQLDLIKTGQDTLFEELKLANYNTLFIEYLKSLLPSPHKNFKSDYFIHSENYDSLLQKYGLATMLSELSFQERCDLYFSELYRNEPNWKLNPNIKLKYSYKQLKSFTDFRMENVMYASRKLGIEPSELHLSEEKEEEIRQRYSKRLEKAKQDEQSLHSHLTHLKVFNKCYLTSNQPRVRKEVKEFEKVQKDALRSIELKSSPQIAKIVHSAPKYKFSSCSDLERRVYPWLTGKLPKYIRWDGRIFNGEIPKMCKFIGEDCSSPPYEPIVESSLTGNTACFLNEMRQQLNGKGIALTIEDRHVEITIRLIRLLRFYGNTLPIQIVYIKGVSEESRNQLIKAARSPFTDSHGNKLVEQELWFVDVSQVMYSRYYKKFSRFGNKILATLFNSFEELMLIDSDTVLFQSPEYFFNLDQYKKFGAFFYRDRSAEFRGKSDAMFFRKMMPSLLDTAIFDIPQVTKYTLDRELFHGLNHYTESGLVMINRNRHFLQALTMAQISFMEPVKERVHGDKELFLLSLTIYGEESYEFNKHFAASIGVTTPLEERLQEVKQDVMNSNRDYVKNSFESKEICSNHPAHISDADNHTLLWINSGFKHCGQGARVNYDDEFRNKNRYSKYDTMEKFKELFNSKLEIKEAIIPPFDVKLGMYAHNDDFEPSWAWNKLQHSCRGYTWCAYSSIGGSESNFQSGIYVQFTDDEIDRFNELGDIWMSDFDFRSERQINIDKIKKIAVKSLPCGLLFFVVYTAYKTVRMIFSNWRRIASYVIHFGAFSLGLIKWGIEKLYLRYILETILGKTISFLVFLKSKLRKEEF
ncbi:putative alpha-1,3-mannosyltransferase Mnn14p [[Candida] railenensis]|uniref:Alpha-1,3-mannosyltransferase Mnn14p n=1 Tax=[Candida] railenensis TaxID=45579 RepID=A0A9P0QPL3_9ASCO|nr:putative alpha-1,3-mannosyltransferase Mnn14p [[Candida] railenensis]